MLLALVVFFIGIFEAHTTAVPCGLYFKEVLSNKKVFLNHLYYNFNYPAQVILKCRRMCFTMTELL